VDPNARLENHKQLYYAMTCQGTNICLLVTHRAVFMHGPKGPGPRAANFQGRHIKKKLRLKYGMGGKKRLSTREKFKGDLH
jgi:hypothetical protein